MIQVASLNFKIDGDREINILMEDAKKLYEDLNNNRIFGMDLRPLSTSVKVNTDVNIFCDVKLSSGQQFDIHILQLKDLYYVLDEMFKKTTNTR